MTGGFTPPTQGDTSTATSKVKLGTLDCLPCYTDQDQNQEADWLSPLLRPEKADQTCRLLCEMANNYLWIEGIPFPTSTIGDLSSLQDQFVVRDEDVTTLAYPKSGTNWIRVMINLIHTKEDPTWVRSTVIWKRSPWVETQTGLDILENQIDPRFFISHLPIQFFPKSFFKSKAKGIYIMRNPRDIIVSGHHFWRTVKATRNPDSFEEHFQWFLQGNVAFGSWFDHIHGWLQMKGKENSLLISYEELHQDTRASVERVSQFLGMKLRTQFSPQECVLPGMKDNKMSNFSLVPDTTMDHSKGHFMRKGITGDWKNHFTVAQREAFDKVYREKMAGLPQGLFPRD